MANEMSINEMKRVTVSDLVRAAIAQKYGLESSDGQSVPAREVIAGV